MLLLLLLLLMLLLYLGLASSHPHTNANQGWNDDVLVRDITTTLSRPTSREAVSLRDQPRERGRFVAYEGGDDDGEEDRLVMGVRAWLVEGLVELG